MTQRQAWLPLRHLLPARWWVGGSARSSCNPYGGTASIRPLRTACRKPKRRKRPAAPARFWSISPSSGAGEIWKARGENLAEISGEHAGASGASGASRRFRRKPESRAAHAGSPSLQCVGPHGKLAPRGRPPAQWRSRKVRAGGGACGRRMQRLILHTSRLILRRRINLEPWRTWNSWALGAWESNLAPSLASLLCAQRRA
jgi:hypothetical protein